MDNRILAVVLAICSAWFFAWHVDPSSYAGVAKAMNGLQQYPPPLPRPPVNTTPERNPTATPEPQPEPEPEPTPKPGETVVVQPRKGKSSRDSQLSGIPLGRITGTVIDHTTGFPMNNIPVCIGHMRVYTDMYGNYDEYLLPGTYLVKLCITEETGIPLQEPQNVAVHSLFTIFLHLFYESKNPILATPIVPTATSIVPPPKQFIRPRW